MRVSRLGTALLAAVLAGTALAAAAPASGATPTDPPPPDAGERALIAAAQADGPQSVIVEVAEPGDQRALLGGLRAAGSGLRVTHVFDRYPLATVTADAETIEHLATSPQVVQVHPNRLHTPDLDTSVGVVNGDDLHDLGVTGSGQTVAVLDTGIDAGHEFVGGRVTEACFSSGGGGSSLCPNGGPSQIGEGAAQCDEEFCDHGTHVAGIAAGAGAGPDGSVNGVAPGADIVAVQVFSRFDDPEICGDNPTPCLLANQSDVIQGLEHVQGLSVEREIASVNMSLGGGGYGEPCTDTGYNEPFAQLRAAGVAPVTSAGNSGHLAAVGSPGCEPEVVSVGATTDDDAVADFSNRGVLLDVFAPGVDVASSVPGGYGIKGGTSMAAPHVAGAFALLRQEQPGASVDELEARLKDTGVPVTYDSRGTTVTTPRIDLLAALPRVATVLEITGPEAVANGSPAELSAALTARTADGPGVPDREVTLTLGAGDRQQSCTGTTTSSGAVTCTIDAVDQPLDDDATVPLAGTFAGDANYLPSDATATAFLEHYTGRAFGLSASLPLPLLPVEIEPTPDTGEIRTAHASTTHTPCQAELNTVVLSAGALCPEVTTALAPGTSTTTSSLDEVRIGLPGLPVIEAENLTAVAESTCAAGGSADGSTEMTLRVGGELIEVDGEIGAEIDLGVARLVVNEQVDNPDAEHGVTVRALRVTGLDGNLADVVVGSATSGVHHCAG